MDGWYSYSEKRRDDPELRARVAEIVEARKDALARAADLLRAAEDVLAPMSAYTDDPIYARQVEAIGKASRSLAHDARFLGGIGSETYIGNLAAGRLGEQLKNLGEA